jgi:hypothetical protein
MNIYCKLQNARIMLQKKVLKKSGFNKFAGYHYFELGDFLPETQEIFGLCGLTGIVSFEDAEATLRVYEHDGEGMILFTSPRAELSLKGCHPIQNEGAIQTYQRRYLWVACMEIVEHDAVDSSEPEVKTEKRPGKRVETPVLDERMEAIVKYSIELINESDSAFCNEWRALVREDQELLWKCLTSAQKKQATEILNIERANNE